MTEINEETETIFDRRSLRAYNVMIKAMNKEERKKQDVIAREIGCSAAQLRTVIPKIEIIANDNGLYLNRPHAWTGYYMTLSVEPWGAALSMIHRWRHWITRSRNDIDGAMLDRLVMSNDREISTMAVECRSAYLAALAANQRLDQSQQDLMETLKTHLIP